MASHPHFGRSPVILALDFESVLVPEIWVAVAECTGIRELQLTTRDVPDYEKLMAHRFGENGRRFWADFHKTSTWDGTTR